MITFIQIKHHIHIAILGFAIFVALSLLHLFLNPMIQNNKHNAEFKILNNILNEQGISYKLRPVKNVELLGLNNIDNIFVAYRNDTIIAVILPVSSQGYSDQIDLLIGIRADGTVSGIHVKKEHETSGLGQLISQQGNKWITQFTDRSLTNPDSTQWALKKDDGYFDQITGATVTSRSVVNAIFRAQQYFKENQASLLNPALDTQP